MAQKCSRRWSGQSRLLNPYAVAGETGGPRSSSVAVGAAVAGAAGLVVLSGGVASAQEGEGAEVEFTESIHFGVEDGPVVDPDWLDDAAAESWPTLDVLEVGEDVSRTSLEPVGSGSGSVDAVRVPAPTEDQAGNGSEPDLFDRSLVGSVAPADGVVAPLALDASAGELSPTVVEAGAPAGAELSGAWNLPSPAGASGEPGQEDVQWGAVTPLAADDDRRRSDDREGVLVAVDPVSVGDPPVDPGLPTNAGAGRSVDPAPAQPLGG